MARGRKRKDPEAIEAKSLMGAEVATVPKEEEKQELTKVIQRQSKPAKPFEVKISFDRWWLMTMRKRKLSPSMKIAVKKHFESRGFLKNGDYENGIEDFGLVKS